MRFSFEWSDAVNPERREIVFEYRNKKYGGYALRKDYQRNVLVALFITVIGIGSVITVPMMMSFLKNSDLLKGVKMTEGINLEEPPPIDKNTPLPPPLVIPPPPVIKTIKFTPPIVVKDEAAEDPPPTQEEVKNVQVSTLDQEGKNDIVDLPSDPVVSHEEEKIFTVVEEMPAFPGGELKLLEMLSHINYPVIAKENNISGKVYLSFVVDKQGKVKDAKVQKGIGSGCDEEALRVLMSSPDWKPGRQNGRNVDVRLSVRVNFTLK